MMSVTLTLADLCSSCHTGVWPQGAEVDVLTRTQHKHTHAAGLRIHIIGSFRVFNPALDFRSHSAQSPSLVSFSLVVFCIIVSKHAAITILTMQVKWSALNGRHSLSPQDPDSLNEVLVMQCPNKNQWASPIGLLAALYLVLLWRFGVIKWLGVMFHCIIKCILDVKGNISVHIVSFMTLGNRKSAVLLLWPLPDVVNWQRNRLIGWWNAGIPMQRNLLEGGKSSIKQFSLHSYASSVQ